MLRGFHLILYYEIFRLEGVDQRVHTVMEKLTRSSAKNLVHLAEISRYILTATNGIRINFKGDYSELQHSETIKTCLVKLYNT